MGIILEPCRIYTPYIKKFRGILHSNIFCGWETACNFKKYTKQQWLKRSETSQLLPSNTCCMGAEKFAQLSEALWPYVVGSVSQACRRNPTEQERAGIHGETLGSTEQPNPQRVLAVSLRLLTLPYSTDFFINPLSKCFSLPHSTDKNTIPSIPTQRILFQLFPLVAAFGKPHSYFLTDV